MVNLNLLFFHYLNLIFQNYKNLQSVHRYRESAGEIENFPRTVLYLLYQCTVLPVSKLSFVSSFQNTGGGGGTPSHDAVPPN